MVATRSDTTPEYRATRVMDFVARLPLQSLRGYKPICDVLVEHHPVAAIRRTDVNTSSTRPAWLHVLPVIRLPANPGAVNLLTLDREGRFLCISAQYPQGTDGCYMGSSESLSIEPPIDLQALFRENGEHAEFWERSILIRLGEVLRDTRKSLMGKLNRVEGCQQFLAELTNSHQ